MEYAEFLARKTRAVTELGRGCAPGDVHPMLHDWQARIVAWAVRKGRAAVWADTGLGKTVMQVEWARLSGRRSLIVAPLAVCQQTVREAAKVGVDLQYVREDDRDVSMMVTNYEMVDRFDPSRLDAVVLDEASILKQSDGKTRTYLIKHFQPVPARLACTATPAPNDPEELTNQAEFLGVMRRVDMLAAYYVHDDDGWRVKGHARKPMTEWMASWAVALRRPSDLGYPDDGYALLGLDIRTHLVESEPVVDDGQLFATRVALGGVGGRAKMRKATMKARVERAVEMVYDCGIAQGVSTALARGEQGEGSGVPRTNEGSTQLAAPRALRERRRVQGEGQGSHVCDPEAYSHDAPSHYIQDGPLRPGTGARPWLLDLPRGSGEGPSGEACSGSRPPHGHGPRCSLPALQPGAWPLAGQPSHGDGDVRLPHGCRDQWLIWCGLNAEQDALRAAFGSDCLSIDGRSSLEEKIELERVWREGGVRVLVTKPDVFALGVNWQHCARMAFVGLSDSYERYYQCIRRCYRYGQTRRVTAHVVLSHAESPIADNIARKEREANDRTAALVAQMRDASQGWNS